MASRVALHVRDERARFPVAQPRRGARQAGRGLLNEVGRDPGRIRARGHRPELVAHRPQSVGDPPLLLGCLVLKLAPGLVVQVTGLGASLARDRRRFILRLPGQVSRLGDGGRPHLLGFVGDSPGRARLGVAPGRDGRWC